MRLRAREADRDRPASGLRPRPPTPRASRGSRAPALRDVDRVERVQVQVDDRRWPGRRGAARGPRAGRPGGRTRRTGSAGRRSAVFLTRNRWVSATPIRALIARSLCGSATPGTPDGGPAARCPRRGARRATSRSPPGRSRAGSSCSWRTAALARSASSSGASAMNGVALRVGRDPDLGKRMADLGHRPQQRQAVRVLARLLGVATDDEGAVDAGALEPRDQLGAGGRGRGSSAPRGAGPPGSRRPGAARTARRVASMPLAGEAVTETVAPGRQERGPGRARS